MATLQFQKTCRRSMHGTKEPDVTHKNTYINKCLPLVKNKNKNETLLVNVSNSTVKNIFENGMIPKLIQ